jgi:Ca2+-binding RTX toxin-like protein
MLGSNGSSNTTFRTRTRGKSRWATLCGMFGMLFVCLGLRCPSPVVTCPNGDADCAASSQCDSCSTCTCGTDGNCVFTAKTCPTGQECDAADGACKTACTADADCNDTDGCTVDACGADGFCSTSGATDCDDSDACTTDTCVAPGGCVHTAVDCDDSVACTDDACDAGACTHTDNCAAGGACNETTGLCVLACDSADVCDDGDACTDDSCVNNACSNTAKDCDDTVACTDDACDAGTCTHTDNCTAPETCDTTTGLCTAAPLCLTDPDCDDGLFCNGAETCDTTSGNCIAGTRPCDDGGATACAADGSVTEVCAEGDTAEICTACPSITLDFTLSQDNLVGGGTDDVFSAQLIFNSGSGTSIASLQTGDAAQGAAGADILNATLNGTALVPTLSGIETQNYTAFAATTLTATNISGVDFINSKSSTATLTVNSLQETTNVGLESVTDGASGIVATFATAVTTGATDAIGVTVNGSNAGAVNITTGATNGFETVNFTSSGLTANALTALTQTTGTSLATATFAGTQALTVLVMPNTVLTYDGSAMTGGLTLGTGTSVNGSTVYATFATANLKDFKTGSGNDVVIFNNTLDGNDASGTTELIDLGAGTDVVQASFGATVGTQLKLRNVEEVRFNATASGVSINLGGVTGLTNVTIEGDGTANTFTLLNVPGTPALNFRGNGTQAAQVYDTITYTSNSATGAADTLAINVNNRGTALNSGTGTANVHTIGGAALTAANIETINVTVTDGPATFSGITAAAASTFSFTASSDLTLGTVAGGTTTSVNASGVTGNFSGTFSTLGAGAQVTLGNGTTNTLSIAGSGGATISITGGSGADSITGSAQADVIAGGAGADVITGGAGSDTLTGGSGIDTFVLSTIVLNANLKTISDFTAGASGDILRFDATTFTDYSSGATVTFATGGGAVAGLTAGVDNVIIRDTAANILLVTPAAGAQAVIAIATDTGNIYYDANGNFTAGSVIIGNIPAAQVASLVAANIVIVP